MGPSLGNDISQRVERYLTVTLGRLNKNRNSSVFFSTITIIDEYISDGPI